ncbi:hypothetical protein AB4Y30_11420 [Ornithinibacillus sp. 4-3]|uniref:Phage protein n=1 Tax=Ornithinibacillus sp. 4-3 TaxID=3231488 RepID=A0AB39HM43_9BACI
MKIEIKNIDAGKVISFLENTNFKGLQSVNRSKVTNYLTNQLTEVANGEKTIREDFKEDKDRLEQELRTYFNQTITVEGANFMAGLTAIKSKVEELTSEESEQEFSGQDAYALSVLYEAFNMDKGEDK